MSFVLRIILVFIFMFASSIVGESFGFRKRVNEDLNLMKEFSNKALIEKNNLNLDKKIILVLGTSTSVISFNENNQKEDHFSYVDILKKKLKDNGDKFIVYNLSNSILENKTLMERFLVYLMSTLSRIDYIVFENLRYTFPDYSRLNSTNFNFLKNCLRGVFGESNLRYNCLQSLEHTWQDLKKTHNSGFCTRKYEKVLTDRSQADLDGSEKKKNINLLIQCGISNHELDLLLPYLSKHHFFQDNFFNYYNTLLVNNIDVELFSESNLIDHSTVDDKIFLNELLEYSMKLPGLKDTKFIVVPNLLKNFYQIENISAIKSHQDRIKIVYPEDKIFALKKDKGYRYIDLFPDGHHYKLWIHSLLSEQLFAILKNEQ